MLCPHAYDVHAYVSCMCACMQHVHMYATYAYIHKLITREQNSACTYRQICSDTAHNAQLLSAWNPSVPDPEKHHHAKDEAHDLKASAYVYIYIYIYIGYVFRLGVHIISEDKCTCMWYVCRIGVLSTSMDTHVHERVYICTHTHTPMLAYIG